MPEHNLLEEKVSALIAKYQQASEKARQMSEKISALEAQNAEYKAKIDALEDELLNKSISDEQLCKDIEQALGLEQ